MSNRPGPGEKADPKSPPAGQSPSYIPTANDRDRKDESPASPPRVSPSLPAPSLPYIDWEPRHIDQTPADGSEIAAWFARDVRSGSDSSGGHTVGTALVEAIRGGDPKRASAVLDKMTAKEAVEALTTFEFEMDGHAVKATSNARDNSDMSQRRGSLIMHACASGNVDLFDAVLRSMEARLNKKELRTMLTSSVDGNSETLVDCAAKGGSQALFEKVVHLLDGELLEMTAKSRRVGRALLKDVAVNADIDTFRDVVRILDTQLTYDQAMVVITGEDGVATSTLTSMVFNRSSHEVAAWAELLTSELPYNTVVDAFTAAFSAVCRVDDSQLRLDGMSVLIAYGADPPHEDLIHLFRVYTRDQLKHSFLGALITVDNPCIPGLTLSIALGKAIKIVPADEKPVLYFIRHKVDEVLLEVLDRLPRSVRDFTGGYRGCAAIFEPDSTRDRPAKFVAPLQKALKDKHYADTMCTVPIMADYMSHKFVLDLPSLLDTKKDFDVRYARKKERHENLQRAGLLANTDFGRLMQGVSRMRVDCDDNHDGAQGGKPSAVKWWDVVSSVDTLLPGAQFILVGTVSEPYSYYNVPAMRMALDFIVYLGVVALFNLVISQEDNDALTPIEIFFTIYITDEILSTISTMWGENFRAYWQDSWNRLNNIALVLLALSNVIRMFDTSENSGVQSLLALSAPLVYARFLFFAQIMRRQGLVIHTISLMIGELLQFGVVLAVIMMGFTMSFYALFSGSEEYSDIWLRLFEAMLGDTSSFDLYAATAYDSLATFLLVIYLVIMAVMLLNLLIAVLSTAHEQVDQNAERESRASKVEIFRIYQRVVERGVLPAPFNVVQLAVCFPIKVVDRCFFSGQSYATINGAFGGLVFWLVSGPFAIGFGSIVWAVSIPNGIKKVWTAPKYSERSRVYRLGRCCGVVTLHLVAVPLTLTRLWLKSAVVGLGRAMMWTHAQITRSHGQQGDEKSEVATTPNLAEQHRANDKHVSVIDMLKKAPDRRSLREIVACLDDPSTNLLVTRDEADNPPTVRQIQILQKKIEATCKNESDKLRASLGSSDAAMLTRVDRLEQALGTILGAELHNTTKELEQAVGVVVERRISKVEAKIDELLKRLDRE